MNSHIGSHPVRQLEVAEFLNGARSSYEDHIVQVNKTGMMNSNELVPHWQEVPHGEVREIWYESKITGTWRHALVYLPPNYDGQTSTRSSGSFLHRRI